MIIHLDTDVPKGRGGAPANLEAVRIEAGEKNGSVTKAEDQRHYYVTEVITIKIMKDFCFMLCLRKHSQGERD